MSLNPNVLELVEYLEKHKEEILVVKDGEILYQQPLPEHLQETLGNLFQFLLDTGRVIIPMLNSKEEEVKEVNRQMYNFISVLKDKKQLATYLSSNIKNEK